ncbi:hypothetical protein [Salipiger abyssi]|uniref:hypothetical protein n=1 Tax=Salipiger abyssi TaxID=1250539 RepID=UPI0040582C12
MSYPSFPAELPPPMPSENGSQRANARRLTTFDAGPPKSSLRFSAVPRSISITLHLLVWQVQLFNRFYEEICAEGSELFWMRDHRVDGKALLDETGTPILNDIGAPVLAARWMLCAWGQEPPVFSGPVVRRQRVSFELVELPA